MRKGNTSGMSDVAEHTRKHGQILDYSLDYNLMVPTFFAEELTGKGGFLKR